MRPDSFDMRRKAVRALGLMILAVVTLGILPAMAQAAEPMKVSYASLLRRVVDLGRLPDLSNLETVGRASSYDSAGNTDRGRAIREQDGWFVVAELEGPGAIVRSWTANASKWTPEGDAPPRIRIYVDDEDQPRIDMDWSDMFRGQVYPFLPPWADNKGGAGNSYIPISYQKNCRVELSSKPDYYQFDWIRFASGTVVEPYPKTWTPPIKAAHVEVATILNGTKGPYAVRGAERLVDLHMALLPGKSTELFNIEGPGAINRIFLRTQPAGRAHLRSAVLRIYWDDSPTPSVECPLGDFFGTAPGVNLYQSLALGMTPEGWYCRFPMPFAKRARAEIVNDSTRELTLSGAISSSRYAQAADVPAGRFFAKWRREDPVKGADAQPGRFLMLDAAGRGRFVGAMVTLYSQGWNGQGDEAFTIDGEETPSIHGTGFKAFIGQGWGVENFYSSLQGCSFGEHSAYYNHWSMFRLFLTDAVPFRQSLKLTMEDDAKANDWSSVCYWYQELPTSDTSTLPPLAGRLPHRYRAWWEKSFLEAETLLGKPLQTDPRMVLVDEGLQEGVLPLPFIEYKPVVNPGKPGGQPAVAHWSDERAVAMRSPKPVDRFVMPFEVAQDGQYELLLRFAPNVVQPKVSIGLDETGDTPSAEGAVPPTQYTRKATLKAGRHEWVIWLFNPEDDSLSKALVVDGMAIRPAE